MFFLFLITLLPLMEIAGFIWIGGEIGIGNSLLWVIADTIAGFAFLSSMGGKTLQRAKRSVDEDIFPFEEMFDGMCIILGSLLLIFPGFISDFLALPLLLPLLRKWIFIFLKSQHNSILQQMSKGTQGFTYWYYEEPKRGSSTTIESEFREIDEDKRLR